MAAAVPFADLPLPLPFKPQIRVTHPPDCQHFPSSQHSPLLPLSPHRLKPFIKDSFGRGGSGSSSGKSSMDTNVEAQAMPAMMTATSTTTTVGTSKTAAPSETVTTTPPPCHGHDHHVDGSTSEHSSTTATGLDPRYLAMVSRVAAYYQQRCQAVANYQHQKCQAWANVQRQKCQEITQAAMLVVAWYVRDRIQRRRKRQKRQFRRGLSEMALSAPGSGMSKAKKNESVKKWMSKIPEGAALSASVVKPADKEELEFSMDNEPPLDKDAELYSVADNLIKSQLSRIDVPLMGAVSFDDSESESDESENEELSRWQTGGRDDDDEQQEQPKNVKRANGEVGDPVQIEDYEYDDGDSEDYSYDDDGMEDYDNDEDVSGMVHKGTGTPKDSTSLQS